MVAANGLLPRSKIRWQASSYKGKSQVLVFVGASLLANGGGKRAVASLKDSLAGQLLQGEKPGLVFVG